jgi:solute carrier family 35 protein C2
MTTTTNSNYDNPAMCKSSSLAFVLLFAFLFKLEKPTYKLTGIILLITAGVVLMVSSETQFDFWGMVEVLSASCLGGLRWSLTQMLLDKQSMGMNTPIATIFWLAPTMGLSLSFCSLIFEGWSNLLSEQAFFGDLGKSFMTMTYIATAGILAYLMTVSEYLYVSYFLFFHTCTF